MATVEQAEWVVDKVDGNIPHTLDAPVDVSFMPTGGLGCWDLWGLGVASTWVIQFPAAPKSETLFAWQFPSLNSSWRFLESIWRSFTKDLLKS